MDMVGRVAFAIAKARRAAEIEQVKPSQLYDHLARAAIAAMRDPTPEMVRAGLTSLAITAVGMPEFEPRDEAELCFMSMIDAALTSSEK